MEEELKCVEWKGVVGENRQQVQRSVKEEIKPEATRGGRN